MVVEWSVIIGFAGLIVAIVGAVIARDRAITNMIHNNHEETAKAIKEGDDGLHERINRTRDEYVKRTDLDGHLQRIEKGLSELRSEMREERRDTNTRLDAVLAAISSGAKSS